MKLTLTTTTTTDAVLLVMVNSYPTLVQPSFIPLSESTTTLPKTTVTSPISSSSLQLTSNSMHSIGQLALLFGQCPRLRISAPSSLAPLVRTQRVERDDVNDHNTNPHHLTSIRGYIPNVHSFPSLDNFDDDSQDVDLDELELERSAPLALISAPTKIYTARKVESLAYQALARICILYSECHICLIFFSGP